MTNACKLKSSELLNVGQVGSIKINVVECECEENDCRDGYTNDEHRNCDEERTDGKRKPAEIFQERPQAGPPDSRRHSENGKGPQKGPHEQPG